MLFRSDVTLEDGENLEAHEPVDGEDLSFDVTSEDGQKLYDSSFDGVDDDDSLGTAMVDINEESGEVVVADEPLKAETVDEELLAIAEADAVVFVTDARAGLTPDDRRIAGELRKRQARVWVAVNKSEGMQPDVAVTEFHELGLGDQIGRAHV